MVKQSKKKSSSSKFSSRTHAACKRALGSELMTLVLVKNCNIIVKASHYPARWRKILDAILEKGKGPMIGKLRTIKLLEADLQFIMRIFLNLDKEEKIEKTVDFQNQIMGREKNIHLKHKF